MFRKVTSIASVQETERYRAEQKNQGLAVSVPIGPGTPSGSLMDSRSKSNADYASVGAQSGIYAGDGGFQIEVQGNTGLQGAVIASTADASRNRLATGTLTTGDLQNHSDASSSTSGIAISSDMFTSRYGATKGVVGNLLDNGNASVNTASATQSAVAPGAIVITNEAAQQALTGQTAEETVAATNRDTAGAHAPLARPDVAGVQEAAQDERAMGQLLAITIGNVGDPAARANAGKKIVLQVCDASRRNCTAHEVDESQIVKGTDGNIYVFNNGIFNDQQQALANAAKQATAEANEQGVYVVTNPYTGNFLSELVYAGYDKLNNILGGVLPVSGSSGANIDIRNAALLQGARVVEVDHSRGSLTGMNATQSQVNSGQTNVPLDLVTFNGAAASAQGMADLCYTVSDGGCTVQQSTHVNDLVGTWIGGNPGTGGIADASWGAAHTNYSGQLPAEYLPDGSKNPSRTRADLVWGIGHYGQPVIVLPANAGKGLTP